MIYQRIELSPKGCHEGRAADGFTPTLTAYLSDNSPEIDVNRLHKAVVICPGGGYCMTSDREAEPVALKLLAEGFHVFVLRYSVKPATFPTALVELATAVALVRENHKEWQIDPNSIVVGGFSAGGHLAANLATFWHREELAAWTGLQAEDYKPNGLWLNYPVITSGEYAHCGSFEALLDGQYTEDMLTLTSLEKQVTTCMPRTFVWHTHEDGSVPVQNAMLFSMALQACHVPVELHVFELGAHGLSLCNTLSAGEQNKPMLEPTAEPWFDLFLTWLQRV